MNTLKSLKGTNSLWTLLTFLFFFASFARAEESMPASEKKKEMFKTFKVNPSDALNIDNRYGNITVTHWNKEEIEVRVVIEAKANTDKRVEELLDYVSISLDKSGNTVYGSTSMKNFGGTRNNERLTVNYYINKPSKVTTSLCQRYGNINLPQENDASTNLEVKYGNIQGGNFKHLTVECSYGNITVSDLNYAYMELAYCGEVKIKNSKKLEMESRYSNSNIQDAESLSLELSYGNFNAEQITQAAIESKYSNVSIRSLEQKLDVEMAYGSVDIHQVSSGFSHISAESRYGNLTITVPVQTAFTVIAEQMKYGNYDISREFNVQTTKDKEDGVTYRSEVNNGSSKRFVNFEGNKYSNLIIKAGK